MILDERLNTLRYAVAYKGKFIAAFRYEPRAKQFAALGNRDTPDLTEPIKVIDLFDVTPPPAASAEKQE